MATAVELPASGNSAAAAEGKFSRLALTAMVVGSMVGAGIFSLPGRFGAATGPFGALIAWAIAGGGMLMLAFVFQLLAERKPDLDSGIFALFNLLNPLATIAAAFLLDRTMAARPASAVQPKA